MVHFCRRRWQQDQAWSINADPHRTIELLELQTELRNRNLTAKFEADQTRDDSPFSQSTGHQNVSNLGVP
jgi:hypothetical protein